MAARKQAAGDASAMVLLTEPAMIDRKRREPGTTVTVSASVAEQLVAAGAGTLVEGAAAPLPAPAPVEPPAPPPADLLSTQP